MADKVERMLQRQREREEAMRQKEEAARQQEQASREAKLKQATPKTSASTSPAAAAGSAPPQFENNVKMKRHLFAPLPGVARGKPTFINGDPNGKNILYCLGNDVVIRNLENPLEAELYIEHPRPTTVARYSPDSQYICSADQTGAVRVWHTEIVQGIIHKLKSEKRALGGPINDLAWSPDGTKIVVVGQGKEKMGDVFDMETGSSRGAITGHAKTITTVDYRPTKPFHIVTGSEDLSLAWFDGPPFKWVKGVSGHHTRFINCVRFSPNGALFASVGQDKLGFFHDGETGDVKTPFQQDNGHTGGIYGCSWSPDGSKLLTCSGDRTCKIWDVETAKPVVTFELGESAEKHQQVGCLWQGDYLVSLSLEGHLTYLDKNNPSSPIRVLKGHNKSIESLAYHKGSNTIYTGSYDSIVTRWNESTGDMDWVSGDGHTNSVIRMIFQGDDLYSVSLDDTVRITRHGADFGGERIATGGKPFDLAVASHQPGLAATGTFEKEIVIIRNGHVASKKKVAYTPQAVAFSQDAKELAVGGDDNKIYLYPLNGDNLGNESAILTGHRGPITSLAYSPDGQYMASADKNRDIFVWKNREIIIKNWVFHTAKVTRIAWSPDSKHIASASLDTGIIVWSIDEPTKRVAIKAAHHGGVNDVEWVDNKTVISVGQDATLREWDISWS